MYTIKNILYIGNSIPEYLQDKEFNVTLYNMDLTEDGEIIIDKLLEFLNYKIFDIILAENKYAFYTMQISGNLKLLINPYIPTNVDELDDVDKNVYEHYLDIFYDGENSYSNFGLFTNGEDIIINNFKTLFYREHYFIEPIVTSSVINDVIDRIKNIRDNDGELVFLS